MKYVKAIPTSRSLAKQIDDSEELSSRIQVFRVGEFMLLPKGGRRVDPLTVAFDESELRDLVAELQGMGPAGVEYAKYLDLVLAGAIVAFR